MAIEVLGVGGVLAQIETNSAALRTVLKPNDVGSLGAYSLGGLSGVMAAGLTSASPIYSWRSGTQNIYLVKKFCSALSDLERRSRRDRVSSLCSRRALSPLLIALARAFFRRLTNCARQWGRPEFRTRAFLRLPI